MLGSIMFSFWLTQKQQRPFSYLAIVLMIAPVSFIVQPDLTNEYKNIATILPHKYWIAVYKRSRGDYTGFLFQQKKL